MKTSVKKCLVVITVVIMVLSTVGLAFAGTDSTKFGFKEVAVYENELVSNENMTIKAADWFGFEISSNNGVYENSEKVKVEYKSAVDDKEYMIFVVSDDKNPGSENIVYIDENTAENGKVRFTIYQKNMEEDKTYTIYMSSNASSGIQTLTKVGTYKFSGNPTSSQIAQARFDSLRNTINMTSSELTTVYDVNGDGLVNETDVELLRENME